MHRYNRDSGCLDPVFYRAALPRSGGLSPGEGWNAVG